MPPEHLRDVGMNLHISEMINRRVKVQKLTSQEQHKQPVKWAAA